MRNKVKSQNSKVKSFLKEIIEKKRLDLVQKTRKTRSVRNSKNRKIRRSHSNKFLNIFKKKGNAIGLIAEVKFASPTNPNLGSPKELLKRVCKYEETGADAISIITEKYFFKGDIAFVSEVKKVINLPILQKDFVIDASQIYDAKKIGSDALLLIARLVSNETLKQFVDLCLDLEIEPVVEVNNEEDLKKAIATETRIIAVNARDLENFIIDVEKACNLLKKIPDKFIKLAFSGIHSATEVQLYKSVGAKGVLVGTSLMQTNNITKFITNLRILPGVPSHRARSSEASFNELRAIGGPSTPVTRKFTKVKVKICGIQSYEDAQKAIAAGADYLGFIFVKNSKRAIDPSQAKKIIAKVRNKALIVGVFRNNSLDDVNTLCKALDFDFVQLHGEEDPEFCQKVISPVIKVFGLPAIFDPKETTKKMKNFNVKYYLIDRENPGEGEKLSLENSGEIAKTFQTFFAGGLTPANVSKVVKEIKPFAVDVISGVKTRNKFDFDKMKRFVANTKGVSL